MATDSQTEILSENRTSGKGSRRIRVFLVLFCSFIVVIAAVALVFFYGVNSHWQARLQEAVTRNLTEKAKMFAARVNADHAHNIDVIAAQEGQAAGAQATVIDMNGKVLADSESPTQSVEAEGSRPEFVSALHGTTGVQTRSRNHIPVLYVAVPIPGGAVRLAYPLSEIEAASQQANQDLALVCAACLLLAAALAWGAAVLLTRHHA